MPYPSAKTVDTLMAAARVGAMTSAAAVAAAVLRAARACRFAVDSLYVAALTAGGYVVHIACGGAAAPSPEWLSFTVTYHSPGKQA